MQGFHHMIKSSPNQSLLGAAMALRRSTIREGKPFPLGATWDGLGVNFALFSAHATKVELCLFDDDGETELERFELPEYTDEVWHGYLPTRASRHGLRLSRSWALRAGRRTPLQSEQAADRSLCEAAGRRVAVGPRAVRLPARSSRQGPILRRARQRAVRCTNAA